MDFLATDPLFLVLMALISFLAAFVSTLIGFGGGIVMLVLLSPLIPAKELVAVVSLVQVASMLFRVYVFRLHVKIAICKQFLIGALPAILLAAVLFNAIDPSLLMLILGSYLIFSAWKPEGIPVEKIPGGITTLGGVFTFISFFVGAPGPAVSSFLNRLALSKKEWVATLTGCLLGQNLLKVGAFYSIGVPLNTWIPICIVMMIASVGGTLLGYRLMDRINEKIALRLVRIAMAVAGINLLVKF